jgi:hypothetical protein
MSIFERRVLAELRKLREAEAALEGMYQSLHVGRADRRSFVASLRSLDERVNRLESLLEGAA